MSKVLSIEVGYSITKICETDYKKKNPKIYKCAYIPTPEGVVDDGLVADNSGFISSLKRALVEKGFKTKQVVFTVTSSKIVTREASLPAIKKTQMAAMIAANANDYFPIDLTEYELAHLIMDVVKEDNKVKSYKVLVMAIDKKITDTYERFAHKLGLKLQAIDYSGNSIYQIMTNECNEETEMVVKVEERSTVASVISGKRLVLQRNMVYGVDDAVQAFLQSGACEGEHYFDAIQQMRRNVCIGATLKKQSSKEEINFAKGHVQAVATSENVSNALVPLISNLARVVDLYNSKNVGKPIRQIRLVGLGSAIKGFAELLSNELGIRVISTKMLTSANWAVYGDEELPGSYAACIGATIAPIGYTAEQKKMTDATDVNYKNIAILSGVAFVLLSVALSSVALIRYNSAVREERNLKSLEEKYLPAEAVYQNYNSMTTLHQEVKSGYDLTEHPNDTLISFLEELEIKLPAEATLMDFASDDVEAILTLKVDNKEQAAKVIQTLRGFKCIMDVNIGAIDQETLEAVANEVIDTENVDLENPGFLFSVHCTYYPVNDSAEQASGNTQTTGTTPAE